MIKKHFLFYEEQIAFLKEKKILEIADCLIIRAAFQNL